MWELDSLKATTNGDPTEAQTRAPRPNSTGIHWNSGGILLEFQWNKRHFFPLEKGNSTGISTRFQWKFQWIQWKLHSIPVEFHLILVEIPMEFHLIPVEIPLDSSNKTAVTHCIGLQSLPYTVCPICDINELRHTLYVLSN